MSNTHGEWLDRIRGRKAMAELKPCPFCGSKARLYPENPKGFSWWVACTNEENCKCNFDPFGTKEEAIEAWNRRASDG